MKELADFHFSAIPSLSKAKVLQLAEGEYIQAECILMLGNPGLGKTHLAISLGLEACRQGYKTRFYNAAGLVNDLLQAQDEHRVNKFLTSVLKYHLIILDELRFITFPSKGSHLIFQFCSTLYERAAMIVTSNLSFADWTQVFGDERLTLALLDRLKALSYPKQKALKQQLESVRHRYSKMYRVRHKRPDFRKQLLDRWKAIAVPEPAPT